MGCPWGGWSTARGTCWMFTLGGTPSNSASLASWLPLVGSSVLGLLDFQMTAAIGPPTVKATISSAGGCSPTLRPLVVSALQQAVFSLQLLIAALNRQGSHRSLGYEETLGNLLREAALSPAKTMGYILNIFPLLCQAKSMGPSGNSLYRERKRGWASPTPLSCHVHPCWSRHLS